MSRCAELRGENGREKGGGGGARATTFLGGERSDCSEVLERFELVKKEKRA